MTTTSSTGTRLSTTTQPNVGTTVWEIDPKHSLVECSVKHMMFTTVKGRFKQLRGAITCPDEGNPASASVEAEIDAASIDTGDESRDQHLRSPDFLDAERYPKITYRSARIEPTGEDQFRVFGELTLRGVTREMVLQTTYHGRGKNPFGQEVAGFTAETSLSRRDFGLTWNAALESGGLLVGDTVDVLIEVQAVRKS